MTHGSTSIGATHRSMAASIVTSAFPVSMRKDRSGLRGCRGATWIESRYEAGLLDSAGRMTCAIPVAPSAEAPSNVFRVFPAERRITCPPSPGVVQYRKVTVIRSLPDRNEGGRLMESTATFPVHPTVSHVYDPTFAHFVTTRPDPVCASAADVGSCVTAPVLTQTTPTANMIAVATNIHRMTIVPVPVVGANFDLHSTA